MDTSKSIAKSKDRTIKSLEDQVAQLHAQILQTGELLEKSQKLLSA